MGSPGKAARQQLLLTQPVCPAAQTNCVDTTIANLLEGRVPFMPEETVAAEDALLAPSTSTSTSQAAAGPLCSTTASPAEVAAAGRGWHCSWELGTGNHRCSGPSAVGSVSGRKEPLAGRGWHSGCSQTQPGLPRPWDWCLLLLQRCQEWGGSTVLGPGRFVTMLPPPAGREAVCEVPSAAAPVPAGTQAGAI